MNFNPFNGGLPGLPDLSSILGGGGGFQFPGIPGFPGMGGSQQQGGVVNLGGTLQTIEDPNSPAYGTEGFGTMNLQALLDTMQRNQQGQGGGQSYIGGQGLI